MIWRSWVAMTVRAVRPVAVEWETRLYWIPMMSDGWSWRFAAAAFSGASGTECGGRDHSAKSETGG